MSTTLQDVLKSTSKKSTSTKNAAWYNKQRQNHVDELANSSNTAVRLAVVDSSNCAVGVLKDRLLKEQDKEILRTILMHPSLPKKALETFATDGRTEMFNDDTELIQYMTELMS